MAWHGILRRSSRIICRPALLPGRVLHALHRLSAAMQWRRERHAQLALLGFVEYARRRRVKHALIAAAREHLDRARSPMVGAVCRLTLG